MNRRELKSKLTEITAAERHRDSLMQQLTATGAALEDAVAQHQRVTSHIQTALAAAIDPSERQRLMESLHAENTKLQATADNLNPRIAQLQIDAQIAVWAVGSRAQIEYQLIDSASDESKQRHFHCTQNLNWLESRKRATSKSLNAAIAAANRPGLNGHKAEADHEVRCWQSEFEEVSDLLADARDEASAVRQGMLAE